MKKIGILGGMTFESTTTYYHRINRQVNQAMGGMHCAEMILYNLDFDFINDRMHAQDWEPIYQRLLAAAQKVQAAGADFLVIATNTMHRFYERLQAELHIPILHIGDCIAQECQAQGLQKVLLLGTIFTMQQDFLKQRLQDNGVQVVVPASEADMREIHRIIIDELAFGNILDSSRARYVEIINGMIEQEAIEGVVLGCTEIELLIKPGDVSIPVIDSTQAHVNGSVRMIVEEK